MAYSADNFAMLKQTLEQASKIVTSSAVSKQDRTNSEQLFIEFRKSKSPYDFCRYLMETSKESYVLFQTVSTLQEAALREWSLLPANLVAELQNFLLTFVINTSTTGAPVDKYVIKQILQTLAVFYKRAKLDSYSVRGSSSLNHNNNNNNNDPSKSPSTNMVKDVIELFKSSDVKLKQICCSLMLALLVEFSNTNKSTKLGLSNDSHFTAKRSFEQNEFKLMLVFVFETTKSIIENLLQNNIKSIKGIDSDSKEMLFQLFSVIDLSFSWEFTSSKHVLKNLIGNFSTANNSSSSQTGKLSNYLEPTPEFKEFFLNPSLVTLVFKCYELFRDDSDMAHACMQPIIQLSTLNGIIFKDDDSNLNDRSVGNQLNLRVLFLNNFLQTFLTTFNGLQIRDYESFNIACLMENIMSPINIKNFNLIDPQILEAFFNLVCGFVINCFKAERQCEDSAESKKYLESYEKVLIAWMQVKDNLPVEENDLIMNDLFKVTIQKYSVPIVEAFIQSRLSYNVESDKENIHLNDDGVDFESIDNDDDSADDDLHRFKEILYSIRDFARFSLDTCLPLFSKLLNEKYIQLTDILKQVIQENMANKNQKAIEEAYSKHLNSISEDLHWLMLISGFVMFEVNTDHEQPKIPDEIMKYSIMCSSYVDRDLIGKLMVSLGQFSPFPNASAAARSSSSTMGIDSLLSSVSFGLIEAKLTDADRCDPIVRIFYNTFQLCEIEINMFNLNMLSYLSPQVSATLVWFLKELARTYLFMVEKNYADLSSTLQAIFGQDTQYGLVVLNYLLRKLLTNFYLWSAENTVTTQSAKLLLELVKHKETSLILLQNQQFWSISRIVLVNEMPWTLLPSNVKKFIMKSLVVSCATHSNMSNFDNNQIKLHFNSTVLNPLANRFEYLNSIKPESIHTESCIKETMSLIETVNGIIEGASVGLIKDLLPFVLPRLQQGVHLLDVYHNYGEIVELILGMFNGVIEKFLAHLSQWPEARNQIYHCFLCLIQVFSKHNSGKKSVEANIEEDYFNDLLLFMTLLNTLHNIDNESEDNRFLNSQSSATKQDDGTILSSVDIILVGLKFLIPLMNQEMLKFQSLSNEYFKLISKTAYSNPEKLISKSNDLFPTLVSSIEYGLNSGLGTEVVRLCLECIIPICSHTFKENLQQTEFGFCLKTLFKTFFEMIFSSSMEMELFDVCSSVLYSFICCFHETYSILVSQLIQQYNDDNLKQKIIEGFSYLTPANFTFNFDKRNRIKFNSRFNEFCIKTYGLLFIR